MSTTRPAVIVAVRAVRADGSGSQHTPNIGASQIGSVPASAISVPLAVAEAYDWLNLVPGAPCLLVQARLRAITQRTHPAVAGIAMSEQQKPVNLAHERSTGWLDLQEQRERRQAAG